MIVEDGVAVGAELEDRRTGERYTVRASNVVVCADGLRTPQLLFASDIRLPALGHYLNEHYQMATLVTLGDEFDPAKYPVDANSIGSVLVPFSDARPMQGGVVSLAGSPYKIAGVDISTAARLGVLAWYAAKDIQYRDAVQFSDTETDFYGMPRMTIHYSRTDKDLATIELDAGELVAQRRSGRHSHRTAPARGGRLVAALPGHRADGRNRRRHLRLRSHTYGSGAWKTSSSAATA